MKELKENFNGIIICLFELVIGILLLINPVGFTSGIIIVAGLIMIVNGLINCIRYFRTNLKEASKEQFLTKGLIAIMAGAFCVLNTNWFIETFSALTVIYGIVVLLSSVEKIQLCVDLLRQKKTKWYLAAISAVISFVCAVIILKNPFSSTTVIWIIAGISLILEAVFDMYTLMANGRAREDKNVVEEVHNKTEVEKNTEDMSEEVKAEESNSEEGNSEDMNGKKTGIKNKEQDKGIRCISFACD